jgi:hypothetical protein
MPVRSARLARRDLLSGSRRDIPHRFYPDSEPGKPRRCGRPMLLTSRVERSAHPSGGMGDGDLDTILEFRHAEARDD